MGKVKAEPKKDVKTHEEFDAVLERTIGESRNISALKDIRKLESASIRELVDGIVRYAYLSGASDVHIDPSEEAVVVRLRIDGILHDVLALPRRIQSTVITRVKVLAELRTDEHQAPQDGRFRLVFDNLPVDLRVSIIPTFYGENIVMRLLVGHARALELEELGMTERDLETVRRNMKKSYGMILATGPTGSGKTTSLYSVLQQLNVRERSIITIEDPIEYAIAGITQIQVNPQTDLTFAHGLRAIVRQDPNIIMVGEIRDEDTANIAINAAMTGHLLLSTLHTNDSAVTLPRLIDMGIEPFMIASTVNIAIGQRLIRKLCEKCASKRKLTNLEQESLSSMVPKSILDKYSSFAEPVGCAKCNKTGYVGRIGIYEVLEVTEHVRQMIMRRENADRIRKAAIEDGMQTMMIDGLEKAAQGITSIGEVLRVIHE
jgi:type II secretory ATPase GspE/PulE/Tfp pilus assembly ATPase PilB-like protein